MHARPRKSKETKRIEKKKGNSTEKWKSKETKRIGKKKRKRQQPRKTKKQKKGNGTAQRKKRKKRSNCPEEEKKRKKKRKWQRTVQWKRKKNKGNVHTWTFLSVKKKFILSFSFLYILKRKLFGGSGEKTSVFHNLFSFLST